MPSPYRTGPPRPLVWVPGVLRVGRTSRVDPFRVHRGLASRWDAYEDVSQWKTVKRYVIASDLDATARRELGLELDASLPARVAALFARAPLLEIRSRAPRALERHPARVVTIGFARNADDTFLATVERGREEIAACRGAMISILEATLPEGASDDAREELLETADHGEWVDRILRAMTGGVVDGHAIALAAELAASTDPDVPDTDRRRRIDALESELEEVEAHASSHREDAEAIARALAEADAGAEPEVPIYGRARRVALPAATLRTGEEPPGPIDLAPWVAITGPDGAVSNELHLPAEHVWEVDDVDAWEPPSRAAHVAEALAAARALRERERRSAQGTLAVVLAIAIGLVALVIAVLVRR